MAKFSDFDKALEAFKSSTKKSMEAARQCAEFAIRNYAEHGNLRNAQEFFDAMPKNYARKNAFALWLAHWAPITMEKGKFVKDLARAKDEDGAAVTVNIEEALKVAFWDFAPDVTRKPFAADDVKIALMRVVKRFQNDDRFEAKDDAASDMLEAATQAIQNIA